MEKTIGDTYQEENPGLTVGTNVQYKIIAYDNVGNLAVEDNAGEYYVYTVIPEFPTWIIAPIVIIAVVGAALLVYFAKVKKTTEKAK